MAGWLSGLAAVVVVKHLSIYVCMYVCVCVCECDTTSNFVAFFIYKTLQVFVKYLFCLHYKVVCSFDFEKLISFFFCVCVYYFVAGNICLQGYHIISSLSQAHTCKNNVNMQILQ